MIEKLFHYFRFFLPVLLFSVPTAVFPCGPSVTITSPMFGMPAFWLQGDNSTVTVKTSLPPAADTISIVLEKSNGPAAAEFELEILQVSGSESDRTITVSVPDTVPVDLFDLIIEIETDNSTITDTQPNAVKVIEKMKDSFSFIHLTDIHVDDIRGILANPAETLEYGVIYKTIEAINLIDPEFVIITGDLVFGLSYFWEYIHLYEVLQKFDVPIFLSIGNHDAINHKWPLGGEYIDGMEMFQLLFAPLNYTFRYGDLLYISLNSMDWTSGERLGISILNFNWMGQIREEQLDWFEEQLSGTAAELILAGLHHPPEQFSGQGKNELKTLSRSYGVNAVFSGHTHYDRVTADGEVLYITTGSLMFDFLSDIHPVFRQVNIENNEIVSYAFDGSEASVPVYQESLDADFQWQLKTPALSCTYRPANSVASKTVTATITNHLLQSYPALSLEFVMPLPEAGKTYQATGGTVVDTLSAGEHQIWYVQTAVGPVEETLVTLQEIAEP